LWKLFHIWWLNLSNFNYSSPFRKAPWDPIPRLQSHGQAYSVRFKAFHNLGFSHTDNGTEFAKYTSKSQ
jgi:outer membrane phospholipase A